MVSDLFFYQLVLIGVVWLCLMLHWVWPSRWATVPPTSSQRRHRREPTPFAGLTTKPPCDACVHALIPRPQAPSLPPPRLVMTRGRRRQIDTSSHFCPNPECAYRGWAGWGNLRANGHPHGGPWRQLLCVVCRHYFLETIGTIFHGKRTSVELIVRVIACLAEGLGMRGTARVFEVDPNTVLQWLVEAAEQLRAFSQYFLHDLHLTQVQLDELFALFSAVKHGAVSEAEAIERLERSPYWVWVAMDPESKLLLSIDAGDRTLAMAQRVVHHVAQVLAPDCAPLFLTDGFREYTTALLTHYGHWVQFPRRQVQGPAPKPRWMPLPALRYAQVVKTVRRRRLVAVKHRVVFGTLAAVEQVLGACGWQINTSFVERLNLSLRQHVAAIGRRVSTLCKDEDGLRQQLAVYHCSYNFCLPHASLRQPLPQPVPTNGTGSARLWRPCTPAMAAGLTNHMWTLKEVLRYRVPPWPQPQTV
jgi:IS1 family transposase